MLALKGKRYKWLVTGVAGFIGSHILETLLASGQTVVGVDSLVTGSADNLQDVRAAVGEQKWRGFTFVKGDVRDFDLCARACSGVDIVLHQAALGSVPRSVEDPIRTNETNVSGFLNVLEASRLAAVRAFVYAASSSTYGDHQALPKREDTIGQPLSPYAVTKLVNEQYAGVYARTYGRSSVGLRYFNVFGPRQDPSGAYAAVIPTWASAMISGREVFINGDGETSRDFCYVANAVQANVLAALWSLDSHSHKVFNVAYGGRTTLNELFNLIRGELRRLGVNYDRPPTYRTFRPGDVRHSQASIDRASSLIGYTPLFDVHRGLAEAMPWYLESLQD